MSKKNLKKESVELIKIIEKYPELEASQAIQRLAKENIPLTEQHRFIEVAEIEVRSVHEGNFARFRVRPSKFFEWQKIWK